MDWRYVQLLGGLLGINVGIEMVKPLFGSRGVLGRPAGATGCDVFCRGGGVGGHPGFPSSHMAIVTMMVTAQRLPFLGAGGMWIAAMAWARWVKRCHNWQQIVAGTFVGLVGGVLFRAA